MPKNEMTQEDYLSDICQQLGELADIKKLLQEMNEKLQRIQNELHGIGRR